MNGPGFENELCLTIGERLAGPNVTPERAARAIKSVAPAMEIIETRGPNSLDVTLGDKVLIYDTFGAIHPRNPPPTVEVEPWPDKDVGLTWMLHPKTLYLAATAERVELHGVAAVLTGRSSLGRLGIDCHISAGLIDDGFAGNITLEIRVIHPVIVWPGMRFAQLVFEPVQGERAPYRGRYAGATGPEASKFHLSQEVGQ